MSFTPNSPGMPTPNNPNANDKTERVYKFFTSAEAIEVVKATPVEVTLGSGHESRKIAIRPLSTKQFLTAFKHIQEIGVPLLQVLASGTKPQISDIIALVETKIDKIVDLLQLILQRGDPEISREWIENNLDFMLDLQLILPAFIRQNGLEKMFSPKDQSGDPTSIETKRPRRPLGSESLLTEASQGS